MRNANNTNRNSNLIDINFQTTAVNSNIVRRNTVSEYEEIVNTTISNNDTISNNPIQIPNYRSETGNSNGSNVEFDNFSVNSNKLSVMDNINNKQIHTNTEKLVSSDNLTQVNKMYATKEPSSKAELKPELLAEELRKTAEDEGNGEENILDHIAKNDHLILHYMQSKSFEILPEETAFCLGVDGSVHSEQAFELTMKELLKESDKLLIVHIFNSQMDECYNFRNKKDTIIEKYETLLLRVPMSQTLFLTEDTFSKIHPLEQVNRIALNHKCSYMITGYYGMKGQKGDNKELAKGVEYLLGSAKMPTIIVKESTLRLNRKKEQFKWLFVFDRNFINCFDILKKFLPLVNKQKDLVYGFTMLPSWVNFDDIKKIFLKTMEDNKVENFEYEQIEYKSAPSELVKEKVNFGETRFDFLVFYNNPEKYKTEKEYSDIPNLITKCASNICFVNGQ